jgi:hypothetical protein
MKPIYAIILGFVVAALPAMAAEVKLRDGTIFQDAAIKPAPADAVTVTVVHRGGLSQVRKSDIVSDSATSAAAPIESASSPDSQIAASPFAAEVMDTMLDRIEVTRSQKVKRGYASLGIKTASDARPRFTYMLIPEAGKDVRCLRFYAAELQDLWAFVARVEKLNAEAEASGLEEMKRHIGPFGGVVFKLRFYRGLPSWIQSEDGVVIHLDELTTLQSMLQNGQAMLDELAAKVKAAGPG